MTGPPLSPASLLLGVNIDHVATVRQARRGAVPDILAAAETVTAAGADGITIHLREDRRHIQDADLALLAPRFRVNLEMAASEEMTRIAIASAPLPHAACLVPERREELTTEGGLDVISNQNRVRDCCTALREAGILVSLFIEPDPWQIEAAAAAGAEFIELHTGRYADVFSRGDARSCVSTGETDVELGRLMKAGESARRLGLRVNAGHGLDLANVGPVLAIPGLEELNIGFSIIARALFVGLAEATREMKARMTR